MIRPGSFASWARSTRNGRAPWLPHPPAGSRTCVQCQQKTDIGGRHLETGVLACAPVPADPPAWEQESTEAGGPCAFAYGFAGDRQCQSRPCFTVRLATESRPRKARMACPGHLPDVIQSMQADHGYDGYYVLTAAPPGTPGKFSLDARDMDIRDSTADETAAARAARGERY